MAYVVVGGVYLVSDNCLTLPPERAREIHETRRPFLVLSGPAHNGDPDWPVVLGCPLSSSTSWRTGLCVKIAAGEAGSDRKTWVRIPALQPLMRSDLQDLQGTLSTERLEEVQARVLEYMGLLSDETEEELPVDAPAVISYNDAEEPF